MNNEVFNIVFAGLLLAAVIFLFVKISLRIRKHGGSMTTSMFAATYEFLDKDKREAVEEVVERKAKKKMDEEKSGEGK